MDSFLFQASVFLLAAVIAVPLAARLGLGSVLGYLLAGLAIGPGLGLVVNTVDIQHFAEFGVVMMLFIIGLEMRPTRLWSLRKEIFGLGAAQVAVCGLLLTLTGLALGLSLAVAFADGGEAGWAVGHDATIIRTTDGGHSWVLQHFDPELERPFLDLLVLDADRAIAVGAYGLMMVTADGGQTWNEADAPAIREEEVHFNSIARLNDGTLFIAGELGMLAFSTDEGATWIRLESPYESSYFGALPDGERGVVVFGLRGTMFRNGDPVNQQAVDAWMPIENDNVATMFGGSRLEDGRIALVGLNGVVTVVDGDAVRTFKSARGTPLSSAIEFGGGLLSVGESGVQRAPLPN